MHPERINREQPPSIRHEGRHGLSPNLLHDDVSRLDFQMTSNFFVSQKILPAAKSSWRYKQQPKFFKTYKRLPKNRKEVRSFMMKDFLWKIWSSLKRNNQEMSYYNRGDIINREEMNINEKYTNQKKKLGNIYLDSKLQIPNYITKIDIHCMPHGYNSDDGEGIYAGSNYDTASLYLATGGELGKYSDGAGWANIAFIKKNFPNFNPKKILDLGCTIGHSTLPLKTYWPNSEIYAIDACAPLLRYAFSRSNYLNTAINYYQKNAEETGFKSKTFDLITSSMFMHEIPQKNIKNIGKEIFRLLKPNGIMLHNEQPQYHGVKPAEQFFREWDTWYNNEPMRCAFRDMNLIRWAENSGFKRQNIVQKIAPGASYIKGKLENFGGGYWFIFSSIKN
ncbi:MAG: Ubiquinone/menaquinone biosynthesis C-methyltransferase UbiE [Alphaproteobacteria bacterium MarineAlpha2_Bin1]|nr:MAG: Ubiquinone/menaquinone biosynthesis C-methyltransferase UbiE [Alphaproteobacteria bacterium MarineAlpha2_Bin1]